WSYHRQASQQLFIIDIVASIFGLVPLFLYGYRFYVWCISGTKPFKLFRDLLSIFLAIPLVLLFVVADLLSQNEATILGVIGKVLLLFTVALSSFVGPLIVILQPTIWLMLLLSILMLLFRTLELIAVRIAESEKGPALATSALLTAAGVA